MIRSKDAGWKGVGYAALEGMIVDLHDADPDAVRARFRKLRLRPFPDDIRSRRGVRVAYDLPRILAILAVFELNALHIPQGQAASIVEATWPEWCRAAIAASVSSGHIDRPVGMPGWTSATVTMLPDAFAWDGQAIAAYATEPDGRLAEPAGAVLIADAKRLVNAIHAAVPSKVDFAAEMTALERSHGWSRPLQPARMKLADVDRGRGFLDDGPYLPRARALLDAKLDREGQVLPSQRARLQAMLDYLDAPAPVDAWKAIAGTGEGEPRLGHLLQAWAAGIGLTPREPQPATISVVASDDTRARAAALVAKIG